MTSLLCVVDSEEWIAPIRDRVKADYRLAQVAHPDEAVAMLQKKRFDAVLVDLELLTGPTGERDLQAALQPFWIVYPTLRIIVLTPPERIRKAVMALRAGASDYLTYPIQPEELTYVMESTYDSMLQQSELDYFRDKFWKTDALDVIQTRNRLMQSVFKKVRSVAPTKSTVLLLGETGTGKGVLARLIHRHSNRSDEQFISVHCGAIPDTLIESELFGHEKGAFTGAIRRKLGKIEIAKGGTLFLDEIGTVTPAAQIKLLQVLQDGTFQRVGGEDELNANVRFISATNVDLKELCDTGQFRKDLYYRLNVFPIEIPPLRDRKEDIPFFVEQFLHKLNRFNAKAISRVHPAVMEAFSRYDWPGNIRELENLVERAHILESSSILSPESFPQELFDSESAISIMPVDATMSLAEVRKRGVEEIERNYLKEILSRHQGRINASAEAAGISTRQLHKLMIKYDLQKEAFKTPPA